MDDAQIEGSGTQLAESPHEGAQTLAQLLEELASTVDAWMGKTCFACGEEKGEPYGRCEISKCIVARAHLAAAVTEGES